MRRLLRKHDGETGVVVQADFPHQHLDMPPEWMHVPVEVEGGGDALLSQVGDRMVWLAAPPGRSRVLVGSKPLSPETYSLTVDLRQGEVALVAFEPPRWTIPGRPGGLVISEAILIRRRGCE